MHLTQHKLCSRKTELAHEILYRLSLRYSTMATNAYQRKWRQIRIWAHLNVLEDPLYGPVFVVGVRASPSLVFSTNFVDHTQQHHGNCEGVDGWLSRQLRSAQCCRINTGPMNKQGERLECLVLERNSLILIQSCLVPILDTFGRNPTKVVCSPRFGLDVDVGQSGESWNLSLYWLPHSDWTWIRWAKFLREALIKQRWESMSPSFDRKLSSTLMRSHPLSCTLIHSHMFSSTLMRVHPISCVPIHSDVLSSTLNMFKISSESMRPKYRLCARDLNSQRSVPNKRAYNSRTVYLLCLVARPSSAKAIA